MKFQIWKPTPKNDTVSRFVTAILWHINQLQTKEKGILICDYRRKQTEVNKLNLMRKIPENAQNKAIKRERAITIFPRHHQPGWRGRYWFKRCDIIYRITNSDKIQGFLKVLFYFMFRIDAQNQEFCSKILCLRSLTQHNWWSESLYQEKLTNKYLNLKKNAS